MQTSNPTLRFSLWTNVKRCGAGNAGYESEVQGRERTTLAVQRGGLCEDMK